ncbi:MAG TPA: putative cytokinetic ring protein SteA [Acidimicrobiales bacterium]|nr:putative cytokinetic ring protein SteA [Acidimicrobiales bacterium]
MTVAEPEQELTPTVVTGPARVDRTTKRLVTRLEGSEVAIIDHADLDRAAAEGLLAGKVRAVVNAAPCTTGRYPNLGPVLLARSGVVVVDQAGPDLLSAVREGDIVTVRGGEILVGGEVVATGVAQGLAALEAARELAKDNLGAELDRFAENTLEYLKRERHVMLERPPPPDLGVEMDGRHVLVVVRGSSTEADLAELMPYIREMRPVLIGVDGGANALLKRGLTPDMIVGDFDSATPEALRSGAKLVVHAYAGGDAPGARRLQDMGLEHITYESPGVSEDVAMLLAWEKGAELIVAVGTHASMDEFLDKGRAGMASTFLTRLLLGSVLVDAKGVSRLYATRVRKTDLALFLGAAMLVLLVAIFFVPQTRLLVDSLWFVLVEKLRYRT